MNAYEIGRKLVEMCNRGEFREAIEALYADDATHVEAIEMPGMPQVISGKAALIDASEKWIASNEVHSSVTTGPWPHGDRFVCMMKIEITPKEGPAAGRRMDLEEACVYSTADGKITKVEFFYAPDLPGT